jgi:hypothetical protein
MNIRRQHGEHEEDERQGSDAPGALHQKAYRAEHLAHTRHRHHQFRMRNAGGHHPHEVGAHAVEVCGRGEQEHDGEPEAGGR